MRARIFVFVLIVCATWSISSLSQVKTRAERTDYIETSRYDDVITFLDTVAKGSSLVHVTRFGYTFEGRSLPLAIVGRIGNATPQAVRSSGRLRVYIQANIHAGEVEGKEAAQILVREIASGKHAQWMDSMVLLIAPIYNADGNERVSLTNRGPQNGPIGGMGIRANAQGLNINRDNIKLDTPEARSMVKLLNDYDPHIMIDLHTTDGSRHAYHLTWEVPNNPVVDANITKTCSRRVDACCHGSHPAKRWLGSSFLWRCRRPGSRAGLDHRRRSSAIYAQLLGTSKSLRNSQRNVLLPDIARTGRNGISFSGGDSEFLSCEC